MVYTEHFSVVKANNGWTDDDNLVGKLDVVCWYKVRALICEKV